MEMVDGTWAELMDGSCGKMKIEEEQEKQEEQEEQEQEGGQEEEENTSFGGSFNFHFSLLIQKLNEIIADGPIN